MDSDQLSQLSCLQSLILAHNALKKWPLSGGSGVLLQLRVLDVSHNPLQEVPRDALQGVGASLVCLKLSGMPHCQRFFCQDSEYLAFVMPPEEQDHAWLSLQERPMRPEP